MVSPAVNGLCVLCAACYTEYSEKLLAIELEARETISLFRQTFAMDSRVTYKQVLINYPRRIVINYKDHRGNVAKLVRSSSR